MAFRQVLLVALAISSASAAPQNVVLRAVPFGAVPLASRTLAAHPISHAVAAPVPVRVAAAPVRAVATPVETEVVDIDPSYHFGYSVTDVKTGDSKTREESRDGDVVTGSYTVADPDGRIRRVTYTADGVNGFNAVVTYDGEAGPPAIPVNAPVAAVAPAQVSAPVIQVRTPNRTVLRTAPQVVSTVANANPIVVDDHATHRIHTAVTPHILSHDVSAGATTFLRNADGSLTPINLDGLQTISLNNAFLRANAPHFLHNY